MRVLVTRARPDAEQTAHLIEALGHDAVLSPVISIAACTPPPDLADAPFADLLLVTSRNAVRALAGHPGRKSLLGRPLLAVGERTASAARELGFSRVEAAEGTALSLVDHARAALPAGGTALYLAGRDRSADLADALAPHNIRVGLVVLYEARPQHHLDPRARDLLLAGAIDAVLHFSARSASLFLAQLEGDPALAARAATLSHLCLSHQVATALKPLAPETVLIARQPEERALIDLLPCLRSPSGE